MLLTTSGNDANAVQTNELNWYLIPSTIKYMEEIIKVKKTCTLKDFSKIFWPDISLTSAKQISFSAIKYSNKNKAIKIKVNRMEDLKIPKYLYKIKFSLRPRPNSSEKQTTIDRINRRKNM